MTRVRQTSSYVPREDQIDGKWGLDWIEFYLFSLFFFRKATQGAKLTEHLVDLSPAPVPVHLPPHDAATVLRQLPPGLLPLLAQVKTHHQVQHADHHHGHEEEAHGGDLHDHVVDPQGLQHGANGRLLHALGQGVDAVQRRVGYGADHGGRPHDGDDPLGVPVGGQVARLEGVQHGDVPLRAQGRDVEDGGEAEGLEEEGLEVAAALAEGEGVILPQLVNLQGHPEQKHEKVGQGEAHQVEVGGVSHFFVQHHHGARQQVPRQASDEDEEVDTGHRQEEGRSFRTQYFSQADVTVLALRVIPTGILLRAAVVEQFGRVGDEVLQHHLHFVGLNGREGKTMSNHQGLIDAAHLVRAKLNFKTSQFAAKN